MHPAHGGRGTCQLDLDAFPLTAQIFLAILAPMTFRCVTESLAAASHCSTAASDCVRSCYITGGRQLPDVQPAQHAVDVRLRQRGRPSGVGTSSTRTSAAPLCQGWAPVSSTGYRASALWPWLPKPAEASASALRSRPAAAPRPCLCELMPGQNTLSAKGQAPSALA
jgi:hypothetical protein